jgi:hypothetical protein
MSASEDEAARLKQAQGNLEGLELSPEEVSKFETAFKDPEFKKMFAEYAAEISDPKNKAESDLYLRQLEYENKAGRRGCVRVQAECSLRQLCECSCTAV